MDVKLENPVSGEWDLFLSGGLTIYEVTALHHQIAPILADVRKLQLDLSAIDECDSAGLQWLMALCHWAAIDGIELALDAMSEPVQELIELFQAHAPLGLATLIPAEGGAHA